MSRNNLVTPGVSTSPPGPRGYPLLGILPTLVRDPIRTFSDAAAQYGDLVSLPVGPQRFYLFNHPDYFKHVLQDNNRNYPKASMKLKRLLGDGLTASEGELWLRQRRLMQPAFHHERLANMVGLMTNAAAELIERWESRADSGVQLDIGLEMMRLTQRVIVSTMFSTSIGGDSQVVCDAFDTTLKHLGSTVFMSWLPDRLIPGRRLFEQALDTIDRVVFRIIEERRRSDEQHDDLLAMLLSARDVETGEGMSDQQLRDEVVNIFLAGHETTATALAWTWHLLSTHPEVERRLHAEVETALGGRTPTFQDLPQLDYLRMIIEEVLRLYPPAWMLLRTALADDVVGGYDIPAGAIVVLSPYVMHRSPAFWEQPERFDPERFSAERSAGRPHYAYAPFGGGPRLCIGKNFALMEAQLILAMVAQRYVLRDVPGRTVKPSIAIVLRPHRDTRMTLHTRSSRV